MNGRRCIALLLMAVFMTACTSSIKVVEPAEGPTHALLTVDSLMWQQPDSALACLVSCFDACTTTEYNRHYANLLLSELLYKNDYAQTNRPELQQAVAYYDSLVGEVPPLQTGLGGFPPLKGGKGNSKHKPISNNDHFFLAARAHYINGVGYYENDSAVQACTEYIHTHKNRKKYQKLLQHRTEDAYLCSGLKGLPKRDFGILTTRKQGNQV